MSVVDGFYSYLMLFLFARGVIYASEMRKRRGFFNLLRSTSYVLKNSAQLLLESTAEIVWLVSVHIIIRSG